MQKIDELEKEQKHQSNEWPSTDHGLRVEPGLQQ